MNTLNNKLIAEFMGYSKIKSTNSDRTVWTHLEYGTLTEKGLSLLKYHTSWDWLIPVVKKIFTLSFSEVKGLEEEWSNKNKGLFDPDLCGLHSDISTVYNCTVEFIKWYNENKPKNE